MAYAIVRTDRMSGTKDPSQLKSARYMGSGAAETAIENGNVIVLSGLMEGEREIYKGVTPAAKNTLEDVYLVASPEVVADERKKNLNEFRNEVGGAAARVYKLHPGDSFAATKEAFDGVPKVGDFALIQASTKIKPSTTHTSGNNAIGKFVAIETSGKDTYYVVDVMVIPTPGA